MTTPAVSPYVPFYAETQPYITRAEFLAAPTGADVTQLVPGGDTQQNGAALDTLISSASSYADSLCYQVLAATTDMAVGEYRIWRDGTIRVPLPFKPVIQVSAVSLGWMAGALTTLPDLSHLWITRTSVRIPVCGFAGQAPISPFAAATAGPDRIFAQVTYVNGYANTTLAAASTADASTITVASALGIFPGMPLTVYDDASATTENVTVAPGYILGSTTVPLLSPLASGHAVGISVSALPRAVKQAVICLTAHLVKTRGAEGLVMEGVSGGPKDVEGKEPGYSEEYDQAVDLLHPFRRVW